MHAAHYFTTPVRSQACSAVSREGTGKFLSLLKRNGSLWPNCLRRAIHALPKCRRSTRCGGLPKRGLRSSHSYSCLSAAIGSIRLTLQAGIQQASVATPNRIIGTPTKIGRLITPFVIAWTEITKASTHPIAAPRAITPKFSRIICRATRPLVAPNVSRTPISRVRLDTAYDTTA